MREREREEDVWGRRLRKLSSFMGLGEGREMLYVGDEGRRGCLRMLEGE